MSAFIVEDKTINRVIGYLNNSENHWQREQILQAADIEKNDPQWDVKLGISMFALNVEAVEARYGEGEAETFRPLNYEYHFELTPNRIQVLKSLQCWIYQCSEGNVPESDLYKAFRDLEGRIACGIVERLDAYDLAVWG